MDIYFLLSSSSCRNVNGITFSGSVKEKGVARNLYAQARARGKAAGIVRYGTIWILLELSHLAEPFLTDVCSLQSQLSGHGDLQDGGPRSSWQQH